MRYKLIFAILFSWNIAFASDNDEEGLMIFSVDELTEENKNALDYARFGRTFNGCIGSGFQEILELQPKYHHDKIQKPQRTLNKTLHWFLPRQERINYMVDTLSSWELDQDKQEFKVSRNDVALLGQAIGRWGKASRQSAEVFFATKVWGDLDPEISYIKLTKCYAASRIAVGLSRQQVSGDLSLEQSIQLVGIKVLMPTILLPINRIFGTEKSVTNKTLTNIAESLNKIVASEKMCKIAQKEVDTASNLSLSTLLLERSQALCSAVNKPKVQKIKKRQIEFYQLTREILEQFGEGKVPPKSDYSVMYKEFQRTLIKTHEIIYSVTLARHNFKLTLLDEFGLEYSERPKSAKMKKLSTVIDEIYLIEANDRHQFYYPTIKLLKWHAEKNNRSDYYIKAALDKAESDGVKTASCILKDKIDYLTLDWPKKKSLGYFRRKFGVIEKMRDELLYTDSIIFGSEKWVKKEKSLIKNINKQIDNTIKFMVYAKKSGNEDYQRILNKLLSCR